VSFTFRIVIFVDTLCTHLLFILEVKFQFSDPLQVPDGPITRSRTKKIKEAMQGLVQPTWAEFAKLSSKTPTFNMGLKEDEPVLMHLIQAT
jgi:hypothetical protein